VNATMRADGKVYSISMVGSGLDDTLLEGAGRLKERFIGVPGVEKVIGSFVPVTERSAAG
jgi:hypothetical protein